jgi:hypothetical protein
MTKIPGLVMVLLVLAGSSEEKSELIQGTSGSRNDALELHAGGLVVREGLPGSAFGTVRVGKGKRQLSYFAVLKHRLGTEGKSDAKETVMLEDAEGESKQTLTIDGKTLQVDYRVTLDRATKKLSRETLTINDKPVDIGKGRVFLVDLTTTPPTWKQLPATLPSEVAESTSKKAADTLAKKVLATLAKQDKKAKSFIDAAGK